MTYDAAGNLLSARDPNGVGYDAVMASRRTVGFVQRADVEVYRASSHSNDLMKGQTFILNPLAKRTNTRHKLESQDQAWYNCA
jgi:hypothetical protein